MYPKLPPSIYYEPRASYEFNGSDFYGAYHVAAQYAGIALPKFYSTKSFWAHGVNGPWENISRESLVFLPYYNPDLNVFVARKDQQEYLKSNGYKNTRAIGVPYAYVPHQGQKRVSGSLLVMPSHSIQGMMVDDNKSFEIYIDQILKVSCYFSDVTVCLHSGCIKNGFWLNEFNALGFDVIQGANPSDRNSLIRMKSIFEQYDVMTTNMWGSHVAYALAEGCRVSIFGHDPKWNLKSLLDAELGKSINHDSVRKSSIIDRYNNYQLELDCRIFLNKFFVDPKNAVSDISLGKWLIGIDCKISPLEMQFVLHNNIMFCSKSIILMNIHNLISYFILHNIQNIKRFYKKRGVLSSIKRILKFSREDLLILRNIFFEDALYCLRRHVRTKNIDHS